MADGTTYALRFASPGVDYPLTIAGPAPWRYGTAHATIHLPDVPADHIIAAGFASTSTAQRFSFALGCDAGRFRTAVFGRSAAFGRRTKASIWGREPVVSVPVDYFDTVRDLKDVRLTLRCAARAPETYLLTVSVRPRTMPPPSAVPCDTPTIAAPSLSQTTLAPSVRHQACSPTATAMALGIDDDADFRDFVASAVHPPTGLCGAWPQNLWAAARRGRLARSRTRHLLGGRPHRAERTGTRRRQHPLRGGRVAQQSHAVHRRPPRAAARHRRRQRRRQRPGSAPPGEVERRYDARAFAAAWMRHRGAAYMLARKT